MATQYAVVKMELNVEKTSKAGKPYKVHNITLRNLEKNTFKNETVFSTQPIGNAVAVLNVGDQVECKWSKTNVNGQDRFDLSEIKPSSGEVTAAAPASGAPPKKGGFGKSAEEQQSIARQNVSRTSMDFVTKLVDAGIYDKKKTSPDFIFDEVLRFARKFEMYVTLQDDKLQPIEAPPQTVVDVPAAVEDDDIPF